ncbi:MAG: competence protein [Cyclobacteriaceae bacterium]|nr:MAG: competence protein [Cyclobacteriaceae bacterium]
MIAWIPYAFVRIALVFIAGILTGIYFPLLVKQEYLLPALLGGTALFVWITVALKMKAGALALIILYLAGWYNALLKNEWLLQDSISHLKVPVRVYQAVIITPAEEKNKTWKYTARITHVFTDSLWKEASGKVLLYLGKQGFETPFNYGDRLLISGMPQPIRPPMNPGEFDYRRFLSFKNIYSQHFIGNTKHVTWLENAPPNRIQAFAYRMRHKARQILDEHLPHNRQRAVAYALLLGITDALDNELSAAYAAAGAMHVLAVSGLHVGIIYGLILLLLKPAARSTPGRWFIAGISIAALWFYAIFTGLSPSVLRAVTMFSFVLLAQPLHYRTNIYNILAASAFTLLVFNPFLIMSVGFQLSYLAVLAIVYLYPLLYHSWDAPGWIGDKIWQITSVSLAAQVGTFVPGLLYFHQFPTYFLLSNLFVIPVSTLILIMGLLLILIHALGLPAAWPGKVLQWLIDGLNYVVQTAERLPHALIEPVYISTLQSWMIIILIISLLVLLRKRSAYWTATAFIATVIFAFIQWKRFAENIRPAWFIVYHTPGYRTIEIAEGRTAYCYADSMLLADAEQLRFRIRPNRIRTGVRQVVNYCIEKTTPNKPWFIIKHKELTILCVLKPDAPLPAGKFDYLVAGHGAKNLIVPKHLTFGQIITDGTLTDKEVDKVKQMAEEHNWKLHITHTQGAFKIKL